MKEPHWGEITFLRWELQKGVCPICGKHLDLNDHSPEGRMVGHHVHPRSKGGTDSLGNCEARHQQPCETWAHKVSNTGNPNLYQIRHFRTHGE